jgi:hypothetical protein
MPLSPRRRRIEKIVQHRQKELDERVQALAAQKAKEAAAVARAEVADLAVKEAELRRRELGEKGSDAQTFLEAGEWLDASSREAVRQWVRVRMEKEQTARVQQTVVVTKMKMKQAEHLSTRVATSEQKLAERKERRRDDEDAARIAQQRRAAGVRK